MDIHEILKRLPHRYPILLVDRVLSVDAQRIVAIRTSPSTSRSSSVISRTDR
jgi:3-hydroxymyristoyl/3-hydroxydecanoyl-(acyl carrier protein) dehydratase